MSREVLRGCLPVLIIGSGPAGLTAALYAARANLKPLVIEGLEAGGQLMLTTMVENWPGYRDGIMGPDLMEEMRVQAAALRRRDHPGRRHSRRSRFAGRSRVWTDDGEYRAQTLIIATGASAQVARPALGEAAVGRGVSTCATCDGFFFKGRPIAVVGGGDTAMEEAIYLTQFASKVTVIHRRDTLRASKVMQDKAFANPKIEFLWNTEVVDIMDVDKGEVTGARAARTS